MSVTEAAVRDALRVVIDPDLGQDIVSLGFVRDVQIDGGAVRFEVRLTTPACPVKDQLREAARSAVGAIPGVGAVEVVMTANTTTVRTGGSVEAAQRALGGVRNVVVVGAGKGGVGKSSTSVNLAYALAEAGARVGLLDADVYGPSLAQLTGAGVPSEQDGELLVPPLAGGVAVVSMAMFLAPQRASILRGPRVTAVLQQMLLQFAWGELDYLLVDLPPGTGDVPITLAQLVPITGAVLVTTPQEVALADTRRAAHLFRTLEVPVLGIVETMSGFLCPSCSVLHPIFAEGGGRRLAGETGAPLLGQIPLDPAIVASGEAGVPLVQRDPGSSAVRAYRDAAGQLASAVSRRNAGQEDGLSSFELVWRPEGGA